MWIHKLQHGTHENRLSLPKILAREAGWTPGAFIAIRIKDERTLELRLLGRTMREAAESLAATLRPNRPA